MRPPPTGSAYLLAVLLGALLAAPAGAAVRNCVAPAVSQEPRVKASCTRKARASVLQTKARSPKRSGIKLAALDSDVPVTPLLTQEEAQLALDRELSLKVGKQMREADYPDEARRWRWSGTALVEVVVTADGLVQDVTLSRSSGFRVLDEQALEVVRRVLKVYMPTQLRGRPQRAVVPIGFQLGEL